MATFLFTILKVYIHFIHEYFWSYFHKSGLYSLLWIHLHPDLRLLAKKKKQLNTKLNIRHVYAQKMSKSL
jgi:hypothetical protein